MGRRAGHFSATSRSFPCPSSPRVTARTARSRSNPKPSLKKSCSGKHTTMRRAIFGSKLWDPSGNRKCHWQQWNIRRDRSQARKGWTAYMMEMTYDIGAVSPLKLTTSVKVIPDTLPHHLPAPTKPKGFFRSSSRRRVRSFYRLLDYRSGSFWLVHVAVKSGLVFRS